MRRLAWLLVAACSGAAASAPPPQTIAPPPAPPPPPEGPSERACDELITHAVALGIDEETEPRTTEADHEAVRRQLRDELMSACRALPQAAVRCAMEATTLTALAACQRTPSSSTSNSKVAPGGITPPAPRSP